MVVNTKPQENEKKSLTTLAQDMADKITKMGGLKYLRKWRVRPIDNAHFTRVLVFDKSSNYHLEKPCFSYIQGHGKQGIFLFGPPDPSESVLKSPYLKHVLSPRDGLFRESVVAKNPAVPVVIDNTLIRCNTPSFVMNYGYMLYNTKETEASQAIAFLCYIRLLTEHPHWILKYDEVMAKYSNLSPRVAQVVLHHPNVGGYSGHSPLVAGVVAAPKHLVHLLKEECVKPVGPVAKTGIVTLQSYAILGPTPYYNEPVDLDTYITEGVKLYEASL